MKYEIKISQVFAMQIKYLKAAGKPVTRIEPIVDMLRYDNAFIHITNPLEKFYPRFIPYGPGANHTLVVFPRFSVPGSGKSVGAPTIGRWDSFGVSLVPFSDLEDEQFLHFEPSDWWTARRDISTHGYRWLSLRSHLEAKDFQALQSTIIQHPAKFPLVEFDETVPRRGA
jgi:hypothetical protein